MFSMAVRHLLGPRAVVSQLNGFLCVYKPRDISLSALKRQIMQRVSRACNSLDPSPVPLIERPIVKPHPQTGALVIVGTRKQPDYTLHSLVNGRHLQPEDVFLDELEPMEASSSGVCLFAVNDGSERLEEVREFAWTNEYFIRGVLGEEADKHQLRGQVVARAKHNHVTKHSFEKVFSQMRHQYRRLSYELSNVDLQSEKAFELACEGAIRPKVLGTPLIYDIRLLNAELPSFTIRLSCVCENDVFLRSLVHEIGAMLDTLARPTRLLRSSVGPFRREHALLEKYFQLPSIIQNIQMCNRIIDDHLKDGRTELLTPIETKKSLEYIPKYSVDSKQLQEQRQRAIEEGDEVDDCIVMPWGRNYD